MADHAPSPLVKEAARSILRHLREHPEGSTKDELGAIGGVSRPSVQRALRWLREDCDSPVDFDRAAGRWILLDPLFSLPLSDPQPEDLAAVLFAQSLLGPIADDEITARLRRLAEQMDGEIRTRQPDAAPARAGTMTATVTTGSRTAPNVLREILGALRRSVIRIEYHSPWVDPATATRVHEIEPWQLRSHDGTLYLRAWSTSHNEARIFSVAQIDKAESTGAAASVPVPSQSLIWGQDDPAFGIDYDRPDTAVVQIRGAVARWVHRRVWHPAQVDRWIEPDELLERSLPYRSCRELARRLLSIGEGVERVEPAALRSEVHLRAEVISRRLAPND